MPTVCLRVGCATISFGVSPARRAVVSSGGGDGRSIRGAACCVQGLVEPRGPALQPAARARRPIVGTGARQARTVRPARRRSAPRPVPGASLTSSAPVRRSRAAKNAPFRRRHGRPIIVERVTRSGQQRLGQLLEPGLVRGHRLVHRQSAGVGTRWVANGSGPRSSPAASRRSRSR